MPFLYDKQLLYLISGAVFAGIFLFLLSVIYWMRFREQKKKVLDRIRSTERSDGDWLDLSAEKSEKESFLPRLLFKIGESRLPKSSLDFSKLKYKFLRAGLRNPRTPAVYWGAKIIFAILFPALFFLVRVTLFGPMNQTLLLGTLSFLALAGFYLPDFWLWYKTEARKEQIQKGVPDALDLLTVCVEAGMGLDAAISKVGQEMALNNRELSEEFKMINLELRAGKSRQEAFRNLSRRTDVEDINSLATTLIQTDRFGTSIAQALRVYSDTFRTRRYQRAEEIAAKLPVKVLFPLLLFIFPSIFIAILGPAAIQIYRVLIKGVLQ